MDENGQAHRTRGQEAGGARRARKGIFGALATVWRVIARVSVKSFTEGIFGRSAQAAFWQTLSLPPLLLGLLGSLGYIGGLFGPDTVDLIESKIVTAAHTAFTDNVVDQIIQPTIEDILARGRGAIVSVGFVLSLWAGSSAISCFVDAIVEAHGQKDERHPVWQRVVALILYLFFLVLSVITLPLVALGPTYIAQILPDSWYGFGSRLIDFAYFPAVGVLLVAGLTTLYKLALPRSLPWHRLLAGAVLAGVFFVLASAGLRFYLTLVTQTGYSYGALATPIAFLLFTFFLGFAVVLGAQFNAVIQEFWPARRTRIDQLRDWLSTQSDALDGLSGSTVTSPLRRIATAPRRTTVQRHPAARPGDAAQPPPGPARPSSGGTRTGPPSAGEIRQLPDGRVS
ncbi:YihY/virulence factor BrkB family protein [Tomitella fengzijianii]|uniref:YihY/virulence factor BrkB family protein n=1 Tax=Tomitella fengzijianii TaxID=2597660 RepID=A0A516X3G0_9ACTN|nr:YihY/virulence factor BrkB family protein [Tomitella fengzijianii]QDQ97608.1 YihY/virulence factor BrkB family protein [Tomitella fengzijianii]